MKAKVRLRPFYLAAIVIWVAIGLPFYVLGEGFVGKEHGAFTVRHFLSLLVPDVSSFGAFMLWAISTALIVLPLLALPFAVDVQSGGRG